MQETTSYTHLNSGVMPYVKQIVLTLWQNMLAEIRDIMDGRVTIKCKACGKEGLNQFFHPYDRGECISIYHSPRSDNEYYWKCPHCGQIMIVTF